MADDKAALIAEARRRGLLSPEQAAAYDELARRGLLPGANPGFSLDAETGKDVLKALPGAAAKGAAAAATAPYDIADLMAQGVGWLGDKAADYVKPGSHPFADAQSAIKKVEAEEKEKGFPVPPKPTYENAKAGLEQLNGGKFYEAKTPVGKIVSSGVESAPSAMTFGGRNLPAALFKGFTSGAASEGAGQAASRVGGAFAGPGAVAGLRRAVTPFPVTNPAYRAAVAEMDRQGLPMTAARRTGSPTLSSMEANFAPHAPDWAKPQAENEAVTRLLMRNTGSPSPNPTFPPTVAGAAAGANNALHEQKGNLQTALDNWFGSNAARWSPATFEPQLRAFDRAYRNIAGSTAGNNVRDITDEIVYGLAGRPPAPNARAVVAGMTGQRYQYIKDRLEQAIDQAGSAAERDALINIRQTLDTQLQNSVSPAARDELNQLNRQWANYKTVEDSKIPPSGVMTPGDVKQRSNVQANLGQGSENARLAQTAERVYTPKEKLGSNIPGPESIGGSLASMVGTYLMGHHDPSTLGTLGILGGMTGYAAKHALKYNPATSAAYHSRIGQGWLGNQAWRPSPATMADPALVAKILATSPNRDKLLPAPQEQ